MYPVKIPFLVYVSCKTEIADLELIGFGADQQVLRLNITVHNVLGMEVVHGLQQLVDEKLYTFSIKAIWFFF